MENNLSYEEKIEAIKQLINQKESKYSSTIKEYDAQKEKLEFENSNLEKLRKTPNAQGSHLDVISENNRQIDSKIKNNKIKIRNIEEAKKQKKEEFKNYLIENRRKLEKYKSTSFSKFSLLHKKYLKGIEKGKDLKLRVKGYQYDKDNKEIYKAASKDHAEHMKKMKEIAKQRNEAYKAYAELNIVKDEIFKLTDSLAAKYGISLENEKNEEKSEEGPKKDEGESKSQSTSVEKTDEDFNPPAVIEEKTDEDFNPPAVSEEKKGGDLNSLPIHNNDVEIKVDADLGTYTIIFDDEHKKVIPFKDLYDEDGMSYFSKEYLKNAREDIMQEENINKKTAKKVDPIIYYELAEFDKENGTNHAERYMTAIKEDKKDDSVKITYDLQKLRKNKDMYFSDKHNLKSIAKRQSNIATVLLNKMRTRTKAILAALGIGGAALLGVASTNTGRGTDDPTPTTPADTAEINKDDQNDKENKDDKNPTEEKLELKDRIKFNGAQKIYETGKLTGRSGQTTGEKVVNRGAVYDENGKLIANISATDKDAQKMLEEILKENPEYTVSYHIGEDETNKGDLGWIGDPEEKIENGDIEIEDDENDR